MPDKTLTNDESITKSKKVVAFTKGAFLALIITSFFVTIVAVIVLMYQNKVSTATLLDCTLPSGECYKLKADELTRQRETLIGSAVEFCGSIKDNLESTDKLRRCVENELRISNGVR